VPERTIRPVTVTHEPGLLTAVQLRTLRDLIEGPPLRDGEALAAAARSRLEGALASMGVKGSRDALWLSKSMLADLERCEGLFQADLGREGPPFEHSENTAAGALFHKAIELDVGSYQEFDVRLVGERAAESLERNEGAFAAYWNSLDELDRFQLLAEAARRMLLFRGSMPPLGRNGAALPSPEAKMRAELAGGAAVLSGKVDLLLIRPDPSGGPVPARLALDLKTGTPRSEHAEDMRFYALLIALRLGAPPYRVATFFLESGEWQAEEVTGETLGRAVERVLAAASTALELRGDREPSLAPGPWCAWCPRRDACPAVVGAPGLA
jgi:PD-(D/E)XK nuclease superfamily